MAAMVTAGGRGIHATHCRFGAATNGGQAHGSRQPLPPLRPGPEAPDPSFGACPPPWRLPRTHVVIDNTYQFMPCAVASVQQPPAVAPPCSLDIDVTGVVAMPPHTTGRGVRAGFAFSCRTPGTPSARVFPAVRRRRTTCTASVGGTCPPTPASAPTTLCGAAVQSALATSKAGTTRDSWSGACRVNVCLCRRASLT